MGIRRRVPVAYPRPPVPSFNIRPQPLLDRRMRRHFGTPPGGEGCRDEGEQEQIKGKILALASYIHDERSSPSSAPIRASLVTARLQICASEQVVQAIRHRLASTRNLLRMQFGTHLHQHPASSAASPATSVLYPKPSKVKVQNLLIRPEHLSRLPNPSSSSVCARSGAVNTSRHKRNELVSAWEGSTYKKVLASSLAAKLLLKMCFAALHHQAHVKRIVRQAAVLCGGRRVRVLMRLCFHCLAFEALSARYIGLTGATRVVVLMKRKYLAPTLVTWLAFARYVHTLGRLTALACAHLKATRGRAGLQLLYWNRAQAQRRRKMLLWAYRRCRSVRTAQSLHAWVMAYTRARGIKRLVAARMQREMAAARAKMQNPSANAAAPPSAARNGADDMAALDASLLLLRKELVGKARLLASAGLSAEERVPDREELNRSAAQALMNPSFSIPVEQASFSFTSAAAGVRESQRVNVRESYGDAVRESQRVNVRESYGDAVLSMSLSSLPSREAAARSREHTRQQARVQPREKERERAKENERAKERVGERERDRTGGRVKTSQAGTGRFLSETAPSTFLPSARQRESESVGQEPREGLFERAYRRMAADHQAALKDSWSAGVSGGNQGELMRLGALGEEGLQWVGEEEDGFSPTVLMDLVSRQIRRARWALRTLRRHSNVRVSFRILSRQASVHCLQASWVAWRQAQQKGAQMMRLCGSIGDKRTVIRSLRKWHRVAIVAPQRRTRHVQAHHARLEAQRSLMSWRKLYWLITAERQLSRMTHRARLHEALGAWTLALKQHRKTRGLRNRVVRRTVKPLFRMWHIKAHKTALLKRVFGLREAAWLHRYSHTMHQTTFSRLWSTLCAWRELTQASAEARREEQRRWKALQFRGASLVGRPFFAWADYARQCRRVKAMQQQHRQRRAEEVFRGLRAAVQASREVQRMAARQRQGHLRKGAWRTWRLVLELQTVHAPLRHRMLFLLRQVWEAWQFLGRTLALEAQRVVWQERSLAHVWRRWRDHCFFAVRVERAGHILLRLRNLCRLREALQRWPGRREIALAEEMRRQARLRGPLHAALVSTICRPRAPAAEKKSRADLVKETAQELSQRSFLERIQLPISIRAAIFGILFSSDDAAAVAGLFEMLRAVLLAWADAAHRERVLRSRARLVAFKRSARLKESIFRKWMGRSTVTAHRMAQWIAKREVGARSRDYLSAQELERKRLEDQFLVQAIEDERASNQNQGLSRAEKAAIEAAGINLGRCNESGVMQALRLRNEAALVQHTIQAANQLLGKKWELVKG